MWHAGHIVNFANMPHQFPFDGGKKGTQTLFRSIKDLNVDTGDESISVAWFQLWMWGLKNDSRNDRSTSPLQEQVFGAIPLVPLFTVSFLQYTIYCVHSYPVPMSWSHGLGLQLGLGIRVGVGVGHPIYRER
jgi:hypothetical protein